MSLNVYVMFGTIEMIDTGLPQMTVPVTVTNDTCRFCTIQTT